MQVSEICDLSDEMIEKAKRIYESTHSNEIKEIYMKMFRDYCLIELVAYQMKNDKTNPSKYLSRIEDLVCYMRDKYEKIQEKHQVRSIT